MDANINDEMIDKRIDAVLRARAAIQQQPPDTVTPWREEYAAKAMQGILADWSNPKTEFQPAVVAARAFAIADAMLLKAKEYESAALPNPSANSDTLKSIIHAAIKHAWEQSNTVDVFYEKATQEILQAIDATGGQESEAQAKYVLVPKEPTLEMLTAGATNYESGEPYEAYRPSEVSEIYRDMIAAAPIVPATSPSALAIDTAAKMQAAEVCDEFACGVTGADIAEHIRDTIPQDGITALEEFGMKVADKVADHCFEVFVEKNMEVHVDDLRAIVTSLIGER